VQKYFGDVTFEAAHHHTVMIVVASTNHPPIAIAVA
jgi:hypothetical protein